MNALLVGAGKLWRSTVFGGIDQSGQVLLGDLWEYDVWTGEWTQVPLLGETPGSVLAASYSVADDRLYVLDLAKVGIARLLQVDPSSGVSRELRRCPIEPTRSIFGLGFNQFGTMFTLSAMPGSHRVQVWDSPTAQGPRRYATMPGTPLSSDVRAGDRGVGIFVDDPQRGRGVVAYAATLTSSGETPTCW